MGRSFAIGLRFVAGAGLTALFGYVAVHAIGRFHPGLEHQGLRLARPLTALACAAIVGFGVALAFNQRPWWQVLWATRAALLTLALMGFAYWRAATWRQGLVIAGLAVAGLILHHVAHRHALGWVIDTNGERQKVDHWIRGRAVYSPTTRNQRMVAEAIQKSERRKTLAISLLMGAPLVYGAYRLFHPYGWAATGPVAFIAALILLMGFLPNLIREILYQLGYQDMRGAKVLDPEVERPGLSDIAAEKAHGDASLANEEEAFAYLNRRR